MTRAYKKRDVDPWGKPREKDGVNPGPRICLRCRRKFNSKGNHNWICKACKLPHAAEHGFEPATCHVRVPCDVILSELPL